MRVLCTKSASLSYATMQGWADALQDIGIEFIFWDGRTQPIFDAFDETEPDIFISAVSDISRGMAKCLKDYPETITLFYSPAFNEVLAEDVEYMQDLANDTGKPDYIFSFCHESRLDETLGGWKTKGYKTISVMRGANTKLYYPRKPQAVWASDFAVVSNYDPYLNPYILPVCHRTFKEGLEKKLTIRIFGDGWPVAQGVGKPEDGNIPNIYASTKIIIDVHKNNYEPSDIPFNVIASGGYCLSNSVNGILDSVPTFNNPPELHALIHDHYNSSRNKQVPNISTHSYKHRMLPLLKTLGLDNEAKQLEGSLNEAN